jgi:hypothetical protein
MTPHLCTTVAEAKACPDCCPYTYGFVAYSEPDWSPKASAALVIQAELADAAWRDLRQDNAS